MKLKNIFCALTLTALWCTFPTNSFADNHTKALISQYDISWDSQSTGPDASMPCGGGEIGLNVWVENGDVMLYFSDGSWLDENNALLKGGRLRLHFTPDPFDGKDFRQILHLWDGNVEISGGGTTLAIWADVEKPVFHIDISSIRPTAVKASYESWRYEDRLIGDEKNTTSWKWVLPKDAKFTADIFEPDSTSLTFRHENGLETIFDYTVEKESLGAYKDSLYNPIGNLVWGGMLDFGDMRFSGTSYGKYADTPFKAWNYEGSPSMNHSIVFCGATAQVPALATDEYAEMKATRQWRETLLKTKNSIFDHADKDVAKEWWHSYWSRSYIVIDGAHPGSDIWKIGRNYQLFRYMLGCNANGYWPTKFNGGLFTFDSRFVKAPKTQYFSPDYRNWCGGTMTAQNQRLVYFPMLKSGDWEMMRPQFDFYRRTLASAELRSRVYWGHEGACYTEQLENYGLPNPAEYGVKRKEGMDPGMQDNRWLEYLWDTSLEFCLMILETDRYCGADITEYLPMIESCLTFFEQHYRYLARARGESELDPEGYLLIFPGSACETYKGARNPASTIAALQVVSESLSEYYLKKGNSEKAAEWEKFRAIIPEIPYREVNGIKCISPAESWERVQNEETPQMYPVFPWRVIRQGDERLEFAINTWQNDPDARKFRSHRGWKQDAIWAACMGLTGEAEKLILQKFADGPHRFPAFWGPGFDWTPDHNWGGSAAIALQEMILGEDAEGNVTELASWPKDWPVEYRLHGPDGLVHTNTPSGKSSGSASMTVDTDLGNYGEKTRKVSLRTRVIDPDGAVVSEKIAKVAVPAEGKSVRQTFTINNPRRNYSGTPDLTIN